MEILALNQGTTMRQPRYPTTLLQSCSALNSVSACTLQLLDSLSCKVIYAS